MNEQIFNECRGIMGTENHGQDDALRRALLHYAKSVITASADSASAQDERSAVSPAGLHPATQRLVSEFANAMAMKLRKAEQKYGYSDGWLSTDWLDECRVHLREHLEKGDPVDVANYCAFLWHHGASTTDSASLASNLQAGEPVGYFINDAPDNEPPHYAQVGYTYRTDKDVFPLYRNAPQQAQVVVHQMRQLAGGKWVETDADGETCLKRMPHWKGVFEFRTLYTAPQAQQPLCDKQEAGKDAPSPDDLRALGLTVAVHNDYRLNGVAYTFWLFTDKTGMSYKGEGQTDAEALEKVRAAMQASPAQADEKRTLICKSCGADRFKEDCKGSRENCPVRGVAQAEAQQSNEGKTT